MKLQQKCWEKHPFSGKMIVDGVLLSLDVFPERKRRIWIEGGSTLSFHEFIFQNLHIREGKLS